MGLALNVADGVTVRSLRMAVTSGVDCCSSSSLVEIHCVHLKLTGVLAPHYFENSLIHAPFHLSSRPQT